MKNFSQPIAFSCRDGQQTEERNGREQKKFIRI